MGEVVFEASPLALVPSNGIETVQSVSPFLQFPFVQFILENEMYILENEMYIRPG